MQKEPLALRISARTRPWIPIGAALGVFTWTVAGGKNGNAGVASAIFAYVLGWALCNAIEMAETPFRKRHSERLAKWRASGCCMECGYDLRACTDRCAECGAEIPPTPVPHFNPDEIIIPTTTPAIRAAVERAVEIAEDRGDQHVGTEHLLLALIDDGESVGGAVLAELDVDAERAETVLRDLLGNDGRRDAIVPRSPGRGGTR